MIRLALSPFSLATRRSFVTFSRNAFVRRTFVTTPFLKNGTFKEQPILTDPSKGTNNSPQKPQNDKNEVDNVKKVFKPEELEAARLARLANLGWLSKLPEKWIPYAELSRLEKPVGSLLLLAPCFWAITMGAYSIAAPITTTVSTIVLFTIGALVMRGAGCTINDILDRNLDNQVALSITFAWGCLLGFPAVGAPQNLWVVAPLFISKFLWCMIYDTVYAHQDKVYDVKAGIKSTALAWGDKSKPIMYTMGGLQVATFLTAGFMNSMGPFFYLSAAWGFQRLFKQLKNVDLDDPKSCWNVFTGNIRTGYIFWIGMIVDYLLKLAGFL
ncbi:hypothetical protein SBP28_005081 [Candidozyma auris]|nr:hypothetical protein CJJ09_005306 [[Candida] auris]